MQFADPQELSIAYLVLRQLYDGDVIEWPLADDHPSRKIFDALEQQGYIARWDRTWPRHDRYRLTESGIAKIESVYRPAGAEAMWNDVRARNLSPADRRTYLTNQGYDPMLWALLHDPSTHWDSYRGNGGRYLDYFWEDRRQRRYRNSVAYTSYDDGDDGDDGDDDDDGLILPIQNPPTTVDLDREAQVTPELASTDYDVS